jgi:hypothetical protein
MRYFALWLGAGLWLSAATVQAAAPRAAAPPDNRPLTLETALAEALAANPALAEAGACGEGRDDGKEAERIN